jgi:glutamyl-tRNA synthetase
VSFEDAKEAGAQIIHWVPEGDNLEVEIVMPDASIVKGLAEPSCRNLKVNDIVQFERFGFARVDETGENKIKLYFAHK